MSLVYKTRWDFIEPYVQGKSVLDIGPAELMGTINQRKLQGSIHHRIYTVAERVVGLEKATEQVHALRDMGYNILEGDAEDFDLGQMFDVIVAGELIEHLSNPGRFIECVRRHLKPDGVFLLTTPNRFDAILLLSALFHNTIPTYTKPMSKHVAYYDQSCLLDLLRRHGFSRFTVAYYEYVGQPSGSLVLRTLKAFLSRFRPRFLAGLMVAAQP
jgi:2-polyprenyl-3-methyl-5-hydroxy-6-metoxy-1,4-benzoquinol methylase